MYPSWATRAPVPPGVNVRVVVQVPPAAIVWPEQVSPVSVYSRVLAPASTAEEITSGAWPELVTVIACGRLV